MKSFLKILAWLYVALMICVYVRIFYEQVSAHRLVLRSEQIKEELRIQEEKRRTVEAEAKLKCKAEIETEAQAFMMNEAPAIKQCLDRLQAESVAHKEKMEKLRQTLEGFGRDPEQDDDFKRICSYQQVLLTETQNVSNRLVAAYIASVKYNASPSRKGLFELRESALRDGIDAASSAFARYEKMKGEK